MAKVQSWKRGSKSCLTVVAEPWKVRVRFPNVIKDTNAQASTTTLGGILGHTHSAVWPSRRNTSWPMWLKRPSLAVAVTMLAYQSRGISKKRVSRGAELRMRRAVTQLRVRGAR